MPIGEGKTVTIIGAGLAGALLACYLAKLGFRVNVYERRRDPRRAGYSEGRSINLALSARGIWGLQGVGLDQEILAGAIPMKGRMMHPEDPQRDTYFQPYSRNPAEHINSISRGGLNIALLNAAEQHDNVELFFAQRCLDIDPDTCTATLQDESNWPEGGGVGAGPIGTVESDLIIGADGAFSAVRSRLLKTDRFEYSQTFLSHGYKELHIPALADETGQWGACALQPNALHIWPRGRAMMIALPNPDKSFTCTLFWPFEGDHSFANLRTPAEVESFFKQHYPDAVPLMPTLAEDYLKNPTSSLVTVRCWPWIHKAKGGKAVALLGDAAHAIVPFFGQGMNAAFEDVRVLADCLQKHAGRGENWVHDALDEYQTSRKPNTDAIARMAVENFVEMRDKVGSQAFLFRKKLEHFLHDLMPATLTPKYNLVSFTTVPYAEALRRGTRIDRVLRFLILIAALFIAALLGLKTRLIWYLLVAVLIVAWFFWDRWQTREDTSV